MPTAVKGRSKMKSWGDHAMPFLSSTTSLPLPLHFSFPPLSEGIWGTSPGQDFNQRMYIDGYWDT